MLLIHCLDDDGGGHLSIDEISDFIQYGSATFHDGGRCRPDVGDSDFGGNDPTGSPVVDPVSER